MRFFLAVAFCAVAFSAFAAEPAETEIAVPAHDIARGDVISAGDLTFKSITLIRASDSLLRDPKEAAGMEARRALRAGEMIRLSDLKRPTLVAKGANVTLVFEAPGMRLTSVGRALAEGGEGDSIAVLNPTSYRQVQAVIVGPGTARVGDMAPVMAANK
jgi:flagella basal body P-ring formation protein FlgA